MWITMIEALAPAAVGLLGGLGLGLAARLARFCALGAIEDLSYGGSDHRARMWGLAIGVAVTLTFAAGALGLARVDGSLYLDAAWNPVAHIVGGLVFGYGMALAGNCGYGAVARLGGGDLRAFVIVLVMGITAYVVMAGPLAPLRVMLFPPDLVQHGGPAGVAHALSQATGLGVAAIGIAAGALISGAALASRGFRREGAMLGWGAAVGGIVAGTWVATTWLEDFTFGATTVRNHTFAEPLGEVILYAMTSSGAAPSFAIGSVAGVWLGAMIGSAIKGHFRWEACEDPRELRRQIFGAVLMGGGAVVSVGCTVGQGLSAISVLSFGAPLTIGAILVGASLGLRHLIAGFQSV